jgi:hypothetical protein
VGKDCSYKHVMDSILTSQVTDTPVVSLDVAVLINSSLHYLLWVAIPPAPQEYSLQVTSFQLQLTTDIEDPLYDGVISNA